ncbi:MAG TPA: DUF4382 domain-containing protein [Bacteroidota bacterium]|jgi:hypothetical protein|nr:DUF4382 domain-containing protein [Bacteroidota bacterium]
MIKKRKSFVFTACIIFTLSVILLNDGCQYDYTSPLPGTVSIRLRTKSDNLDFSPLNNFVLKVTQVEAVRDDGARAIVYEDTKAIGRTTNTYNTLDVRARDSNIVMGEAFLPPGNYIGINMLIEPGGSVTLDGYRTIPVSAPQNFDALLRFRKNYTIREGATTKIVVTIDLDNALLKRANSYSFEPIRTITAFLQNFDSLSSGTPGTMGSLPLGWTRSINSDDPTSGAWGIRGDSSSQDYPTASSRNNCYSTYTQSSGSWVQSNPVDISSINLKDVSFPFVEFGFRFSAASQSTITLQVSQDASFASYFSSTVSSQNNTHWHYFSSSLPQESISSPTVYFRWLVNGSGESSDVRIDDVVVGGHRLSYYISSIQ